MAEVRKLGKIDMEYGEDIKAAKSIVAMFLKARKNLRMYPPNNPVYANTLGDAFEKFKAFFSLEDKLVLTLNLYEIYYGDTQIYHNEEQKDSNLAFFFYKDGLRELTFSEKMPFEEMAAFLKVISLDFDNEVTDDDTVTLFWEKDFQYIRYVVEDEFLADEDYEEQAVSKSKAVQNDPDKFKSIYDQSLKTPQKSNEIDIVAIEEEELKLLFHELEEDANDKIDKFMDIIFEIFYKSRTQDEFSQIAEFFKNGFEYAIKKGNTDSVVKTLTRLRNITLNDKVPDTIKSNIKKIIQFAGSEHIIYLLGEHLDSGEKAGLESYKKLIRYYDKRAIPPFMNLLSTLNTIYARKAVIDILVFLGPMDFITVTKGLNSPEWFVVRNIIYVLREIGDSRATDYLLKKVNHDDIRVKIEVIRTLGELGDSRALAPIVQCLDSDIENQLKFTAIRALGSLKTDEARNVMLSKIMEKNFLKKEFNEKKEYFHVLSRWKDKEMVTFLTKILAKKTIFPNTKTYETKACAAYSLGLIGSSDDLPYLYKGVRSSNKLYREYSESAIQRIDNETQKQG